MSNSRERASGGLTLIDSDPTEGTDPASGRTLMRRDVSTRIGIVASDQLEQIIDAYDAAVCRECGTPIGLVHDDRDETRMNPTVWVPVVLATTGQPGAWCEDCTDGMPVTGRD